MQSHLQFQREALSTHNLRWVSKAKVEGSWVALARWDTRAGGGHEWPGWELQQARVTHPLASLERLGHSPHVPLWVLPCTQKCCVMVRHVAPGH